MQDIRYRGPFAYRGLRVFALLAMTASQMAAIFLALYSAINVLDAGSAAILFTPAKLNLLNFLKGLGAITFPLLLIASMSAVIRNKENIFRVMIQNFLLAGLTYLFIVVFVEDLITVLISIAPQFLSRIPDFDKMEVELLTRILQQVLSNPQSMSTIASAAGVAPEAVGVVSAISGTQLGSTGLNSLVGTLDIRGLVDYFVHNMSNILSLFGIDSKQLMEFVAKAATQTIVRSHLNINVFLDLFLCTVFYFFIDYKPKKLNGGKLLLFRCCSIFPILYLIIGIVLTGMNRAAMIRLPLWIVALLPSRKIPGILLFLFMVLYVQYHEKELISKGGTAEDLSAYLETNRNSLRFSTFISLILALMSLADFLLNKIPGLSAWSVGTSQTMFFAIPFVMLFSYNRNTRLKILDVLFPVYYILNYGLLFSFCIGILYYAPEIVLKYLL